MRLSTLEPQFLRREERVEQWTRRKEDGTDEEVTGPREYQVYVDTPQEADGITFMCPKCFEQNKGSVGTHWVLCWSPKVPPDIDPKPGRWNLVGTNYEDLSLVAGSSSVLLTSGCEAHFFVQQGNVTFA
jgi:hypothetical protein